MTAIALDLFVTLEPDPSDVDGVPQQLPVAVPAETRTPMVELIAHSDLHPDPNQPRTDADDELRLSIATSGIIEPLVVRMIPLDMEGACAHCGVEWADLAQRGFILHNGERRWRGAAGVLEMLPCIVRTDLDADPIERLITQLAANAHKAMAPLDEARSYKRILDANGASHAWLAARIGKKRQSITDRLALLKNEAWLPLLDAHEITVSQMVELSRYADESAERHEAAIATMRSRAGELPIASMELAEFRMLVRGWGYPEIGADSEFGPDEPSITDVEQSAGEAAAASANTPLDSTREDLCDDLTSATEQSRFPAAPGHSGEGQQGMQAPAPSSDSGLAHPAEREPENDDEATVGAPHVDEHDTSARTDEYYIVERDERESQHQQEQHDDTAPANHDAAPADAARGTAPAVRGEPSRSREASPRVEREGSGESVSELPVAASSGGLFQQLAPLIGERPTTLMIGPSKVAGAYRVTIIPSTLKKGESAALTVPLSVDGTPAELDDEMPAAIAQYLARRGTISEGVAAAAASMAATKKASRPASSKAATRAPAAKQTTNRPGSAIKNTAARKAKVGKAAKAAVPKKPMRKAKPARKVKPVLRPDAALEAITGPVTSIKLAAAMKAVHAYARQHDLLGTGALRGMISCDEQLRAIFGAAIVKLNQLPKLLKSHIVASSPDSATSDSGATRTPPLNATADTAQLDWTTETAKTSTTSTTMNPPQSNPTTKTETSDGSHGE